MRKRYPTMNKMGWAITADDYYTSKFIEHAVKAAPECVLEVGAAYGFTAREALAKGAYVIINDLDKKHLEVMQQTLPRDIQKKATFMAGDFLNQLDLHDESVQGILAARVFHMLDNIQLGKALDLMFAWLKPTGKAFITAATPYTPSWSTFSPVFCKRKTEGVKNPGLIEQTSLWSKDTNNLPKKMQLFDPEVLETLFSDRGFKVIETSYIDRENNSQVPIHEKKDSCGIIVQKL